MIAQGCDKQNGGEYRLVTLRVFAMSISIGSDLIFDVVKAAKSQKVHLATVKLGGAIDGQKLVEKFKTVFDSKFSRHLKVSQLPTDLISDVIDSADQNRLSAAVEKLSVRDAPFAPYGETSVALLAGSNHQVDAQAVLSPKKKEHQQFEAMVLRNFVEDMMPKSTASLYGKGTAGEVWRSMQADFMSQEIAKSGGIGIARILDTNEKSDNSRSIGDNLNRIVPNAYAAGAKITPSVEWPYFKMDNLQNRQS